MNTLVDEGVLERAVGALQHEHLGLWTVTCQQSGEGGAGGSRADHHDVHRPGQLRCHHSTAPTSAPMWYVFPLISHQSMVMKELVSTGSSIALYPTPCQ